MTDYTSVTETPGTMISREAASMALSRYEYVRRLSAGKRVLDIACGSGQGLGYIAGNAASVIGGDITRSLLARAQSHYRGTLPLVQFDAHRLPFSNASFDVIQIHEAIYYMAEPSCVFRECRRVLVPSGALVVTSINPAWADFNPSPFATKYLTADELRAALGEVFNTVRMQFGFAVSKRTPLNVALSLVKRGAVHLDLIPRTMSRKKLLKRVFLGPLLPMPTEIHVGLAPVDEPLDAPVGRSSQFRVIYAVARP